MAYQDTPQASKGNAFCWHSWAPRIDWRRDSRYEANSQARTAHVDAQRAGGKEPLFIPGMGSAYKQNPLDAARFAIATIKQGARHGRP